MARSGFDRGSVSALPQQLAMTSKLWLKEDDITPLQIPAAGEIDLFWVDGNLTAAEEKILFSRLAPGQQEAALRFKVESARQRYIISRIVLSNVLARYLGCTAEEVEYKTGQYGKPCLAKGLATGSAADAKSPLVFNMSHSGDVVTCAVAAAGWLGIDVESHKRKLDFAHLGERFFAAEEVQQLKLLAADPIAQQQLFFRIWTLKEAFIKAIGLGLSYPLHDFAVKVDAAQKHSLAVAQLLRVDDAAWQCADWSLISLRGPDAGVIKDGTTDYISALAYAGVVEKISGRHLSLASFI